MEIKEKHKKIMRDMGLKDEDFLLFDGQFVRYEYDEVKGIRLYDPYYRTSYNEYMDVDGWTAWSSEKDIFMSTFLKPTHEEVRRIREINPTASDEKITQDLKKKFGKKIDSETEN